MLRLEDRRSRASLGSTGGPRPRQGAPTIAIRAFAALLGVWLIGAFVVALARGSQDGSGSGGRGAPGLGLDGRYPLFEELELTKDQRQAWIGARRDRIERLRPSLARARDLRDRLREQLESNSPDEAAVGRYVIALYEIRSSLAAERADLEATLAGVLNRDQRARYEALKAANRKCVVDAEGPEL